MRICTDREAIAVIDLDECLGLSLATINTNFSLLKEANCLTQEEIDKRQNQLNDLNSRINSLSSELLIIPKALVTFKASSNPSIINSLRVISVSSLDTGVFQLSFVPQFNNNNYTLIGTSFELSATPTYTWVQPTTAVTSSAATINIRNENGDFINPEYISITVFNT